MTLAQPSMEDIQPLYFPENIENLAESIQTLLKDNGLFDEGICISPSEDTTQSRNIVTTEQTALALIAALMTLHGYAEEPPTSVRVHPFELTGVLADPLITW